MVCQEQWPFNKRHANSPIHGVKVIAESLRIRDVNRAPIGRTTDTLTTLISACTDVT